MRWSEGGSQEDAALVAQLLAKALTGDDDGDEDLFEGTCVRGDMGPQVMLSAVAVTLWVVLTSTR
jgi:hypothetical protein